MGDQTRAFRLKVYAAQYPPREDRCDKKRSRISITVRSNEGRL